SKTTINNSYHLFHNSLTNLRPPSLPLFPYTTLFRSRDEDRCRGGPDHAHPGSGRHDTGRRRAGGRDMEPSVADDVRGGIRRAAQDRKSTRLNSSHVKISYAVFCLKKKTILT